MKGNAFFRMIIVLGLFFMHGTVSAQGLDDPSGLASELENLINSKMASDHLVGVSAALIMDDSLVWEEAFGYADKENDILMSKETAINIASITKTFTALAVMQLRDEGIVDISQPLNSYLPQFHPMTRGEDLDQLTVRSVITHSSGIQTDILKNSDLSTGSYTDVLGFINETYLLYPPGLVESYSNSGYNILGHLVKEKSGQDYTEYIHQHVFAPLGMEHSGFFTDPMENRTRTYAGEQSLIEYGFRDIASGGIYTSIHDLAKYAQGLMDAYNGVNNVLAARETIREMFSLQTDDALVGSNKKGLGWFMFANDSLIAVTHAGDAAWGHALLCLVPEKHTAGMILINSAEGTNLKNDFSSAFISACGGSFADIAHPPIIDRIHEGTTGITLPVTLLQQYAGDYSQGFSYVNVYMENEDLLISRNNKVYVLRAVTENEFIPWEKSGQNTLAEKRNERYFILDTCGIHILVHKSENSETLLGHRLDPFDPSLFDERLGSYENYGYQLLVGDTDFLGAELSVSGDRVLMLKLNTSDGPYSFVLNMISDEYAVTSGLGTGYGFTVRLTEDETYYIVDFAGLTFRKSKDSNTGEPEFYGSAKVFSLAENYPYPFR